MPSSRTLSSLLRRIGLSVVAASLVGLLLAGCVRILEPRQANISYYLLDGGRAIDSLSTSPSGVDVGLREPQLASYLDASRIVTRYGPNRIEFSEFHRWGETLSRAINRVVAVNLEPREGIGSTETVPFAEGASFDYLVRLHVLRFEGRAPEPPDEETDPDVPTPLGHSNVVIRWVVYGPDGEAVKADGVTRHKMGEWEVANYDGLVSRLGTSLDTVAADLGEQLRRLERE